MFLGGWGNFYAVTPGEIAILLGGMETEHTRFWVIHRVSHKTLQDSGRLSTDFSSESARFILC